MCFDPMSRKTTGAGFGAQVLFRVKAEGRAAAAELSAGESVVRLADERVDG
jgi:hypothetical protein